MHTITLKINNKIREIRQAKGYSQEYMAYGLGISQQTYSRLENGRQDWRITQMAETARILCVNPIELVQEAFCPGDELTIREVARVLAKIDQMLSNSV